MRYMNSWPYLSILGLSLCATAYAAPVSPDEALARLSVEGLVAECNGLQAPRLIEIINDAAGSPSIYHFSYAGDKGFMLLPADDAVPALLGYSETNSFATRERSESMRSWLGFYSDQIKAASAFEASGNIDLPSRKSVAPTRAGEMSAIEPLIKTVWDQGRPFNNECPSLNGRQCVTGCVATAMAQVMNYWEYPQKGKGSVSYSPESFETPLQMDFSSVSFNWAGMQDSYKGNYSSSAAHAVATLMKACGYSVRMQYSPGESGAYSKDIAPALINNFGYDQGVRREDRTGYSNDEWNALIYNDLVNVGPVILDGRSTGGAHCFVCDGYDGKGFFHINWGWSGLSDGYFLLNELTPGQVGTGGHYGGYNINQDAILGIMPPVGRLTLERISIDNAADDTGNTKEWGYTYRTNDPSNILLSVSLKIAGGHINTPLYYTVHNTDPQTKKNLNVEQEGVFDQPLNASDGNVKCTTPINMKNFDPGKLYTIIVAYDLKGQKTSIGSIRLAASSGVDRVMDQTGLSLSAQGNILTAESEEEAWITVYDLNGSPVANGKGSIDISSLSSGVYIARAHDSRGGVRSLKVVRK